jgi:hypothetical protein
MLEVTEMKTLRRIINKTKRDRMRNGRIRESCEIRNITSWVQRRRIEWSEHISRMADDRLVRKVRDGIPEGKRSRGRPMKRWRDALEKKQAIGLQEEKKRRHWCQSVLEYQEPTN